MGDMQFPRDPVVGGAGEHIRTLRSDWCPGVTRTPGTYHAASPARARIRDWDAALGRHPSQSRQIFRKPIEGRVRLTPRQGEPGRFDWVFRATSGRLFAGIAGVQAMVPPEGGAGLGAFSVPLQGSVRAA